MKASLGHYVEDGHQASVRELLAGHNFMSFTLFFQGRDGMLYAWLMQIALVY